MKLRRYFGKLYYHTHDHVDVSTLIVRENEIAFALASVTKEHGRWEAESGKAAVLQVDGSYLAKQVQGMKNGVLAALPWDIAFRIEHEELGEQIELSGEIREGGKAYPFEGELNAKGE